MSLLAFTGVAGYFMFTSYGISLTSGLHVSIIDLCITISYNFFQHSFERENSIELLDRNYIGCYRVLFITIPSKSANQEVSLIGDILILLSTFLFAFYTVLLKRPKQEQYLSNEVFTTLTLIIGAVILLPFALVEIFITVSQRLKLGKRDLV